MRQASEWTGTHLDVGYLIRHWDWGAPKETLPPDMQHGVWNYYVIFTEFQTEYFDLAWLAPGKERLRSNGMLWPSYEPEDSPLAHGDFYGGITFYEKREPVDRNYRAVKVGCDYVHYWDTPEFLNENILKADVVFTINKLNEVFEFKRRCTWSGVWLPESEMVRVGDSLYSPDGLKARNEAYPEKQAQES